MPKRNPEAVHQCASAARQRGSQRPGRQQPEERGWWLMPDRPTLPEPTRDQGEARLRADLPAYLGSLFFHNWLFAMKRGSVCCRR